MTEKTDRFLDGCHRYGWLAAIAINAILLAYFMGGLNREVEDLSNRLQRIENIMDRQR